MNENEMVSETPSDFVWSSSSASSAASSIRTRAPPSILQDLVSQYDRSNDGSIVSLPPFGPDDSSPPLPPPPPPPPSPPSSPSLPPISTTDLLVDTRSLLLGGESFRSNLRDVFTVSIYLASGSNTPGRVRSDVAIVLVIRDELGFENYWYPFWPFFRYVGYTHKREAYEMLDSSMIRSYCELRCMYDLPDNLELRGRYMNEEAMCCLLSRNCRAKTKRDAQRSLREIVRTFKRHRTFALVELVRTLTAQRVARSLPP